MDIDREGRTGLHYVAVDHGPEQHLAVARDLVAQGADPALADQQGWTPLHFAASEDALELARYLLSLGVAVDPRDAHGNTPLFRAVFASQGEGEMIRLLREHGADPFVANEHGVTPVGLARTIGNYPVARFFDDLPDHD